MIIVTMCYQHYLLRYQEIEASSKTSRLNELPHLGNQVIDPSLSLLEILQKKYVYVLNFFSNRT